MDEPIEQYKPAENLELKKVKKELSQKFTKIHCPSCKEEISSNGINLQNSIAKCSSCNVIFSIEKEMENVKTKHEIKQQILRPEGIDLFYFKDELDLTIDQHIQGLDAWAIVFTPLIAAAALLNLFFAENPLSPYFAIISSLIALYYIYKAFNYSKYKVYIDINNEALTIRNRPKNFKKDKKFTTDEIDQLYLKHSAERAGYFTIHMLVNGLEGQKHEKLFTVSSLSKAKYLEQEIEKYLNIEDRKIPEATIE